jgi:hypothetical protein
MVDEGARGLEAGDDRDARQCILERVAVVRVAIQGADIGHKQTGRPERARWWWPPRPCSRTHNACAACLCSSSMAKRLKLRMMRGVSPRF